MLLLQFTALKSLFIMSLLNALHFYNIGACSLNWSVDESREQKLREILNLQNNEITLIYTLKENLSHWNTSQKVLHYPSQVQ